MSYAVNAGDIGSNIYSLEIEPHLAETSATNLHHGYKTLNDGPEEFPTEGHARLQSTRLGKAAYKYNLESISTLILGGYDENSFTGDLNYYDTSATEGSWNITTDYMLLGGKDAMALPGDDSTPATPMTVEFQTGYPYIGLSEASWAVFIDLIDT